MRTIPWAYLRPTAAHQYPAIRGAIRLSRYRSPRRMLKDRRTTVHREMRHIMTIGLVTVCKCECTVCKNLQERGCSLFDHVVGRLGPYVLLSHRSRDRAHGRLKVLPSPARE